MGTRGFRHFGVVTISAVLIAATIGVPDLGAAVPDDEQRPNAATERSVEELLKQSPIVEIDKQSGGVAQAGPTPEHSDKAWVGSSYETTEVASTCPEAYNISSDFLRFADKHARGALSVLEMIFNQTGYNPPVAKSSAKSSVDVGLSSKVAELPADIQIRAGLAGKTPQAYADEVALMAAQTQAMLDQAIKDRDSAASSSGQDGTKKEVPNKGDAGALSYTAAMQWDLLIDAIEGAAEATQALNSTVNASFEQLTTKGDCFTKLTPVEDAVTAASVGETRVLRSYEIFEELARIKTPNGIVGGGLLVVNAWCETGDIEGRIGQRSYPAPENSGDGSAYTPSHQFTPTNGSTISESGQVFDGDVELTNVGSENQINVAAHVTEAFKHDRKALHWQNIHVYTYVEDNRMGPEAGGAYFHDWYRPLCYSNQYDDTEHFLGPVGGSDVWFGYLDVTELREKIAAEGPVVGQTLSNTGIPAIPVGDNAPFVTVRTATVRRSTDDSGPNSLADAVETSDVYNTVFVSEDAPIPAGESVTDAVGARLDANIYPKVNTAAEGFIRSVLSPSNVNNIMNTDLDGSDGPDAPSEYFESSSYSGVDVTLDSDPVVNAATGETRLELSATVDRLKFNIEKTNGTHAGYVDIGPITVSVGATVDIDASGAPSVNLTSSGIDIGTVWVRTDCNLACWGKSAAVRNFVKDELGTKLAALLGQTTEDGESCFGFNNVGFSGGAIIGAVIGGAIAIGLSVVTGGAALAVAPLIAGTVGGALVGGSIGFSHCSNVADNGTVIDTTFWDNMAGFWGSLIGDFDVTINDSNTNPILLTTTLDGIEDAVANLDLASMLDPLTTDELGNTVRTAQAKLERSCNSAACTNGLKIETGGLEVVGSVGIGPSPAPAGWATYNHPDVPFKNTRSIIDSRQTISGKSFDLMGTVDMDGLNQAVASLIGPSIDTSDTTIVDILPAVVLPGNIPDFPGLSASLDLSVESTVPPVLMPEEYRTPFTGEIVEMSNGEPYPYTMYVPGLILTLTLGEQIPGIDIDQGDVLLKANVGIRAGVGVSVEDNGKLKFEVGFGDCPGAHCPIHLDFMGSEHLPDYIWPLDIGTLADEGLAGNMIKGQFAEQLLTKVEEVLPSEQINLSSELPNSVSISLFEGVVNASLDLPDYVWLEEDIGAHGVSAWVTLANNSQTPGLSLSAFEPEEMSVPGGGVWGFHSEVTATPNNFPGSGSHVYEWEVRDGGIQGPVTHTETTMSSGPDTLALDHSMLTWTTTGSGWDSDHTAQAWVTVTVSRGGMSLTQNRFGSFTVTRCGGFEPC